MSVLTLLDEEDDEDAFAALPDAKPLGPRLDVLGAAGRGVVKGAIDVADSAASFARDLVDWRARPMPAWQRRIYEQEALSQDAEVAERARAYVDDYDRNVETIKAGRLQRALNREAVFNPTPGNVVNDVAYGVGQFAPAIAATAVNPALGIGVLGSSADAQGRLSEAQQLDQGVDADTAAQVGATTRAAVFIGGLLPGGVAVRAGATLGVQGASITARNLGTRLALRASSGAALNVGAGVAERVAIGSILEKAGYAEQAKAYRWDDATSLAVDALLGAAFGSVEGAPAARVGQRRKVLEDADALHARHQTAPGIPLNAAAEERHDRALALAAGQIERGDDVDLSSIFTDEDDLFAPALLDEPEARGGEDALFTPEAGQETLDRSEGDAPRFLSSDARLDAEVSAMVEEVRFLRSALPARLKARGKSLASFVVTQGGVRDDGGDVLAVLGDYKARPGLINNRRGLDVDDMARMAWEEGYFPELTSDERPSVNQFLEALDGDLRKTSPRYLGSEDAEYKELRQLLLQYERLYVDVEADEPQLRAQLRAVAQRQRLEERAAAVEVAREIDSEAPDAFGASARKWTQADEDELREGFPLFGSQRGVGGASVGVATQALRESAARAFGVGPEIVDRLLSSGKLRIVETDADARRLLDASKTDLPDGQGGIFRAATGEAVIVAANLDPATAHRVMLHEVGVHAGMRGLLGEKRFARLLGSVDAMLPQALRESAEYRELVDGLRLLGRDREALRPLLERLPSVNEKVLLSFAEAEAFSLRPEQRAEEALAYLVENAPELPLVQRVLASIRQWLWRTFGTTFGPSLTQADLQMMAVAALRRESSLAPTATGMRGVNLERDSDGRWVFRDVDAQLLQEASAEVDSGRPGETVVVFDPASIRSVHAAFDPDYLDSANLLASFGRLQPPEGRAELVREMTVAQGDDLRAAWRGDASPFIRATAEVVRDDPDLGLTIDGQSVRGAALLDAVAAQALAAQQLVPVFPEAVQCAIASGGVEAAPVAREAGDDILQAQAARIIALLGAGAGVGQVLTMDEAA